MVRSLLVLVLLTSSAIADEQREELVAPERPTCKPNGAVWFELDRIADESKALLSSVKLYANGTTTLMRRQGEAEQVTISRCIPPKEMQAIEKLLKGARWKSWRQKGVATCRAYSPESTVVKVFGKKVFTEHVCSAQTLDEKSAKALEELKAKLPRAASVSEDCLNNPLAKGCS